MFDDERAFEVSKDGFLIEGAAGVFSGSSSPIGNDAPVGSLYLQTIDNGIIWKKFDTGTSDWVIFTGLSDLVSLTVSQTNAVTTSSGTFQGITGFNLTVPEDGKYLVLCTCTTETGGLSTEGEIGLAINGVVSSDTIREHRDTIILLAFLLNLTVNNSSRASSVHTVVDLTENDVVQLGYRNLSTGGSMGVTERCLTLVKLGA